jgi:hypothetical protein
MLAVIGPLVGVSFINAVRSYAEASGKGGAAAGLADALFPLDGVVAPTFSALEIAASFLLPFVAIRAMPSNTRCPKRYRARSVCGRRRTAPAILRITSSNRSRVPGPLIIAPIARSSHRWCKKAARMGKNLQPGLDWL